MLSLSAVYVKALILLELTMLITKFTITVQLTDMSICMYVCPLSYKASLKVTFHCYIP